MKFWAGVQRGIVCFMVGGDKPMDEEGKPLRGYRKRRYAIWKERQRMVVTEQRLCDQARMKKKMDG